MAIGALLFAVAAAGCTPRALVVTGVEDIGTVSRPSAVLGRDVGISAPIGSTITWLFGDTLSSSPSCLDGRSLRTSTAAVGTRASVLALSEPADCGVPRELFQYQADEPFIDGSHRTALWPGNLVPTADGRKGLIYYGKVRFAGATTTYQGVGLATIEPNATAATRRAGVLFGPAEPVFDSGSLVDGGYVYLYATEGPFASFYKLARVPHDKATSRSAYTFWDGAGWSSDVSRAATLVLGGGGDDASGGAGGLTVSWNPHLGQYLMVHSQKFRNDIMLRTAPRPEGPWSAPTHVDVPDSLTHFNFSAREHVAYRSPDGRTVYVSSHRSLQALRSELRVVRIRLG